MLLVGGAVVGGAVYCAFKYREWKMGGDTPVPPMLGMVEVQDADFLKGFIRDVSVVKRTVWDASRMTDTDRCRVGDAVTSANRLFERVRDVETGGEFALGLAASDAHVCFKFVALAVETGNRSDSVASDARKWLETSLAVYEHDEFTDVGLDGLMLSMKPVLNALCSGKVFVDELD